ncbi:two-component response regulator 24-like [Andrographis paniculata]|uniref:two-component response regulator 24-like n=1 Tax=Andrographis paniculata TaxID=175694 RepID=UPI0021E77913|nr:two-component response regulator 24-like [Andrographis paniculata]
MLKLGSSKKRMTQHVDLDRKIHGLVVDDNPLIRRVHSAILNRHGLETDSAENGKVAVDLFLSGKKYDLVVMDMEMPVMDGIQATERLRAMGVKSMIIGVTARGLDSEKEAFIRAGLDKCWEKPLNVELLNAALNELTMKV